MSWISRYLKRLVDYQQPAAKNETAAWRLSNNLCPQCGIRLGADGQCPSCPWSGDWQGDVRHHYEPWVDRDHDNNDEDNWNEEER